MKLIIFNDINEFSTNEKQVDYLFGDNCFAIGDLVDLASCKLKDIDKATKRLNYLVESFTGHKFIFGDKEAQGTETPLFTTTSGILLTHGDQIAMSQEDHHKARLKKPGKNLFQRVFTINVKKTKITDKVLRRAAKYAKRNRCRTIVMGHFNPKKVVDRAIDGVRVIILPRGRNEIIV